MRHALRRPTWSHRNRWGLVALPLALTAALAGSSDRVQVYFWETGLHRPTTGPAGQWVEFHDSYTDSDGKHPRDLRVRLVSVRPVSSTAMAVTLDVEADPRLPLSGCSLALRDAEGTRYDYLFAVGQPVSPCVPDDAPGPQEAMGDLKLGTDGKPRPRTWTVSPVVVVPAGTRITSVDLWWQLPRYLRLTV